MRKKELNESVIASYKDGNTRLFNTIEEASEATGLTPASIKSRCSGGTGAKSKDGITFKWADEHTRRAKLAKKSKHKGNSWELEVINSLKEIGYTGCVSSRSQNKIADANKIDIIDINDELPVNIQVKYLANTPNYFGIRDSCSDKSKPFCVIWKKATNDGSNSPGAVAVIPLNYFYELIKK